MLTVHHLQVSQSERIVWLCEELGLDYDLKCYPRDPYFSPQAIKDMHRMGAAPLISDTGIRGTLGESGACMDWILTKYGSNSPLVLNADHEDFDQYLYWLHAANGSLQPAIMRAFTAASCGVEPTQRARANADSRLANELEFYNEQLSKNEWLTGKNFTVADLMTVTSLTTMRRFTQQDLTKYPAILAWLGKVAKRDAYVKAMAKGDPDMDWRDAMSGPPPLSFQKWKGL